MSRAPSTPSPHIDSPVSTESASATRLRAHSLVHALSELSESIPTDIAYTFLVDGENEEENITFRELDLRAKSVAARLQRLAHPGERAALVYESGIEYIVAMVGCFYAGVVAVPIYPPDAMRIRRTGARLRAILQDSQAKMVLTGSSEYQRFGSYLSQTGNIVVTEEIPVEDGIEWQAPQIGPQTLALLQYTSGSTGRPRGVMLTHANLMFNFEHILKFDEPDAVAVSWLPMYHDMGLIGLVLQVLQSGRRTVLMSPLSFVKRPFRWLRAISKYRAYATSGPSFAYDLCVQKISDEERAELDLSCWTLACNGAEPVRPDTLQRFTERFSDVGFRPETFYPCYGLAEATLIVSGGDKQQLPVVRDFDAESLAAHQVKTVSTKGQDGFDTRARAIVSCGRTVDNQEIKIVDPSTCCPSQPDQVGEIWVRGPGVARGYWNAPEATAETFDAFLADSGEGPYLRTGDLGFLENGELFVTGRMKDLIIVRGRNHYPQDLERTVESCHRALRRDHGAAFSVDVNGEERVVIVFGVARPQKLDLDELFSTIRASLLHEHEVAPHAIVLVKGSEVPKTSSGKIQRSTCKDLYLSGSLDIVAEWQATSMSNQNGSCQSLQQGKDYSQNGYAGITHSKPKVSIVNTVSSIIRELKNGSVPARIDEDSYLFADLSIESIDLVMLNELVEQRYERQFPFTDFMAELGRRDQRDVSVGQFADFILLNLETDGNSSIPQV